ncbi:ADAP1 protein, partial [Polypterus senegalus]
MLTIAEKLFLKSEFDRGFAPWENLDSARTPRIKKVWEPLIYRIRTSNPPISNTDPKLERHRSTYGMSPRQNRAYPEWASSTLGIFICHTCSGIHRNISEVSKVKSLTLARWEDGEVQFMSENGNLRACAKYEAEVPMYYYKPSHKDCQILKEQWIRAKYERNEFTEPEKELPYEQSVREGFLWKRGRDNGQFFSRRFVLSDRDGTLKYFAKNDAKEPKITIKVDTLNATFQPAKIGNPNGLQLTFLKDFRTRNIFIYHESSKEIVDWFNAIRAVQLHYLQVAFPGSSNVDDAFAKGEVFIGHKDLGYSVKAGLPQGTHANRVWHYGITIATPDRSFLFTCESESEQKDWITNFNRVIQQPMSPQEYANEDTLPSSSQDLEGDQLETAIHGQVIQCLVAKAIGKLDDVVIGEFDLKGVILVTDEYLHEDRKQVINFHSDHFNSKGKLQIHGMGQSASLQQE